VGCLDGKVVIVTGAGQGVGRGVALALAGEGARVVVLGRTMAKCEAVSAEIAERGGAAVAVGCDIEHRDQVERSVAETVERWGRIDSVVNNAQSSVIRSIRKLAEGDMDAMWQSGPMAALRFMQVCFPHLRATQGSVINMGSGSSILPQPAMGGYAMVKEAVRVLTRVAAMEWGRYGIRVNAICPLAASPGFEHFNAAAPGAVETMVLPQVPLGRLGDAEVDIGRAVVFLCGPDSRYVTGTTLMVDGGYNYLR
jgi:NAD(P)-dependent dehydrogenase (short-subunit alcohol dehydrogenase family)